MIGWFGLACTWVALALMAYAAASHLGRPDKKVHWSWRRGVIPFGIRLFGAALVIQLLAFIGRIALGSS